MEVFLSHIRQLLPVLGSELLTPVATLPKSSGNSIELFCRIKNVEARGQRTQNGFVIFKGSSAVAEQRPSAETYRYASEMRNELIENGTLVRRDDFLEFTRDTEFSSPSAAAAVVHGGNANGLTAWKSADGRLLKQIDEQA
jgi:hypothetical protein